MITSEDALETGFEQWGIHCLGNDPEELHLKGYTSAPDQIFIEINIESCVAENLPPGEQCMTLDELEVYYSDKLVFVATMINYIDFEDIDNPIKSLLK